ncbi:cell division protein ZapA [Bacillaceae bacterium W0354]
MSESEKTKVTVDIHNRKYTVVGKESAEHIKMVASLVDQKMDEIRYAKPSLDTTQLAVLTALNTMSDYLKLKDELNVLLQKDRKEAKRKKW